MIGIQTSRRQITMMAKMYTSSDDISSFWLKSVNRPMEFEQWNTRLFSLQNAKLRTSIHVGTSQGGSLGFLRTYHAARELPRTSACKGYQATHVGAVSLWTKINIFLVFPALIAVGIYTLPAELNHIRHLEEHPNEYTAWPHLRKRKNEFPWGNEALFHNKNNNAVPSE